MKKKNKTKTKNKKTMLTVAELARLKERKKRSSELSAYWKVLLLVAIFYALPAVQFVASQYQLAAQSGSFDEKQLCFFNFKCAHSFADIFAFNNVISNIGYVLVGFGFLLFVRFDHRRALHKRGLLGSADRFLPIGFTQNNSSDNNVDSQYEPLANVVYFSQDSNDDQLEDDNDDNDDNVITHISDESDQVECGVDVDDVSLYYALGWSVVFEGLFSALYHICPSSVNFQVDTLQMLVAASLMFLIMIGKRHPSHLPSAFRAYSHVFVFVLFNLMSLLPVPTALFWVVVALIIMTVSIRGSIYLYTFENTSLLELAKVCAARVRACSGPSDRARFALIVVTNAITLALTIVAIVTGVFYQQSTLGFVSFVLGLLILMLMIYLTWYFVQKLLHHEHIHWISYTLLVLMFASWTFAIHFYRIAISNKFLTYEQSKSLNAECIVFDYFDSHDVWHFVSAVGLLITMMLLYTLDRPLRNTPRSDIAVF
jgi:dsRNA-gated channel SID-1